jgi:hypothetical protein
MMKKLWIILLLSSQAFAGRRVVLNWTPSISSNVDHYRVYRSTVPGGPYILLGVVPASSVSFTNGSNPDGTPLSDGATFCYVTTAIAGQLESVKSNEACIQIPVAPQPPTNLQGVAQ